MSCHNNLSNRSWDEDPSTSTIERVALENLEFPTITVCPVMSTQYTAARSIMNMIDFDDKVKGLLPETIKEMKKKMFQVYESELKQGDIPFKLREFGWIADFGVDGLVNLALRKSEAKYFAVPFEGNLYNNLFEKVSHLKGTSNSNKASKKIILILHTRVASFFPKSLCLSSSATFH